MRDSLLAQENGYLADLQRRCDAASAVARRIADAESIASDLSEWCRNTLFNTSLVKAGNEDQDLSHFLTLPADPFPFQVFQRIPEPVRQGIEEDFTTLLQGQGNDLEGASGWLFGQALAKGLVDKLADGNETTEHLLERLPKLIGSEGVLRCLFEQSLREQLHGSRSARSALLSELESRVHGINKQPQRGIHTSELPTFNRVVEAWRSSRSIDDVWDVRGEELFLIRDTLLNLVPCLLPTDRSAILDCLNGFDFPHLLSAIFQHPAILHDRAEIAAILESAPICSDDGRSWNESLLVLLVLKTVDEHCRALWRATHHAADAGRCDSTLRETTAATLSSWVEELGHIVMARPDGQFLGPQWLLLEAANEPMNRAHHVAPGHQCPGLPHQSNLIEWIAFGLSKGGLTSRTIAALVDFPMVPACGTLAPARRSSSHPAQLQPSLGALSMMALVDRLSSNASSTDEQMLLGRLDGLLAIREPAFEVESNPYTDSRGLPASCFGYVLADVEEPAQRWRQSWDSLVEQRRRAQHWRQTDDSDALAPSFFLLAVGAAGIDWLLSSQRHDRARGLWRVVFDGMRDCWLTVSLMHWRVSVETRLGQLFAQHSAVFGSAVGKATASEADVESVVKDYSELLAADLGLLGGDDLVVTVCLLNAYCNGATLTSIDKLLKLNSGHVNNVLRQFERWQKLERPVRRRTEIVDALNELRSKLR